MRKLHSSEKGCSVIKTLRIIGSKWTLYIIHSLFDGPMRFGELQRVLSGISPKTLSLRLSELEKEKIITKKVYAEVPLHVEYSLTEKGKSLRDVFISLEKWGNNT